jgi:hypothetical protein
MSPSDILSPQLGAVSSGRAPKLNYEDYIESASSMLPALEEAEYARKVQEEQIALDNDARRQARVDANIALGIQGAQLATNPLALKYGGKVLSALTPKPPVMQTINALPSYATEYGGGSAMIPSYATEVPGGVNAVAPAVNTTGGKTLSTMGKVSKFGGSALADLGAGYTVSSILGEKNRELGKLGGLVKNPNDQRNVGGAMSGMAAGAAMGSVVPGLGTLIGGALGGIGGILGGRGHCIMVSACFDKDSEELETARAYRDKFFTKEILRGYYVYSEPIVDLMNKYPEIKEHYRTTLVEPLLRVARFKLKLSQERPSALDCAIAMNFTNLWHDIGASLDSFTRRNGEII